MGECGDKDSECEEVGCPGGCGGGKDGLAPNGSSRSSYPSMGVRKVTMGPRRAGQVVTDCESHQKIMEALGTVPSDWQLPENRCALEQVCAGLGVCWNRCALEQVCAGIAVRWNRCMLEQVCAGTRVHWSCPY